MNMQGVKYYFTRELVENNLDTLFIFTDNSQRSSGYNEIDKNSYYYNTYNITSSLRILYYPNSTQACIRSLDNAFPISTMVDGKGRQWDDSFLTFETFKSVINFEFSILVFNSTRFKSIVYNDIDAFGDGNISKMRKVAPKCWEYLNKKLLEIGIDNVTGYESISK